MSGKKFVSREGETIDTYLAWDFLKWDKKFSQRPNTSIGFHKNLESVESSNVQTRWRRSQQFGRKRGICAEFCKARNHQSIAHTTVQFPKENPQFHRRGGKNSENNWDLVGSSLFSTAKRQECHPWKRAHYGANKIPLLIEENRSYSSMSASRLDSRLSMAETIAEHERNNTLTGTIRQDLMKRSKGKCKWKAPLRSFSRQSTPSRSIVTPEITFDGYDDLNNAEEMRREIEKFERRNR